MTFLSNKQIYRVDVVYFTQIKLNSNVTARSLLICVCNFELSYSQLAMPALENEIFVYILNSSGFHLRGLHLNYWVLFQLRIAYYIIDLIFLSRLMAQISLIHVNNWPSFRISEYSTVGTFIIIILKIIIDAMEVPLHFYLLTFQLKT